jgi:hypothetical protein
MMAVVACASRPRLNHRWPLANLARRPKCASSPDSLGLCVGLSWTQTVVVHLRIGLLQWAHLMTGLPPSITTAVGLERIAADTSFKRALVSVIETGTRSNIASALAVAVMEILLRSRLVAVINLLFRIDLHATRRTVTQIIADALTASFGSAGASQSEG